MSMRRVQTPQPHIRSPTRSLWESLAKLQIRKRGRGAQGSAGWHSKPRDSHTPEHQTTKHMLRRHEESILPHHLGCSCNFPGAAAAREIAVLISAHAPPVASRVRLVLRVLRVSGCLGSDHEVFVGTCLDVECSFRTLSLCCWCARLGGGLLRGRALSRDVAERFVSCASRCLALSSRRFAAREVGLRVAWSFANSIGC